MKSLDFSGYVHRVGVTVFAAVLVSCSGSVGSTPAPAPGGSPPQQPIQHIVVLVQENRSFNTLFAGFPGPTQRCRDRASQPRGARAPTSLRSVR